MQSVDPGYLVQHQISEIQPKHATSIKDAVTIHWELLREEAFQMLVERHLEAFPYETEEEVRAGFLWLCGPEGAVKGKEEKWRTGDATRAELLIEAPEVNACKTVEEVLDSALTEMLRNIIRRLHAHEAPLVLYAFQVFQQATQPTQLPVFLLLKSARKQAVSPKEILQVVKERPEFWKSELLDIATSFISSMPGDPEAKTMQVASVYQRIKALYEEIEEVEEQKPKRKK